MVNIKDFILDKDELSGEIEEEAALKTATATASVSNVVYDVTTDNNDILIKRITPTGKITFFALLPSKNQFYINRNGKNLTITDSAESVKEVQNFFKDATKIDVNVNWITSMYKQKKFVEGLTRIISNVETIGYIKKDLINLDNYLLDAQYKEFNNHRIVDLLNLYKNIDTDLLDFYITANMKKNNCSRISYLKKIGYTGTNEYFKSFINWSDLQKFFTKDQLKDYYQAFLETNYIMFPVMVFPKFTRFYTLQKSKYFKQIISDYEMFKKYTLINSVKQGFAYSDFSNFIIYWYEYLDKQVQLYNCIKEPFPESVLVSNQKIDTLAITENILKIDEKCLKAKKYNWVNGDYVIRAAENYDELITYLCMGNHFYNIESLFATIASGRQFIYYAYNKNTPDTINFIMVYSNKNSHHNDEFTASIHTPDKKLYNICQQWKNKVLNKNNS